MLVLIVMASRRCLLKSWRGEGAVAARNRRGAAALLIGAAWHVEMKRRAENHRGAVYPPRARLAKAEGICRAGQHRACARARLPVAKIRNREFCGRVAPIIIVGRGRAAPRLSVFLPPLIRGLVARDHALHYLRQQNKKKEGTYMPGWAGRRYRIGM